ncbi:probable serine carboxypeptidase CPVL [Dermacentor silvarum]|uniref:probable serine carboxypeptidase CPVL n=1 Tax=Dermacentor silvarum TaxID=543639 RepID=UPI0021010DDB|nr:probable serine carboxypeptidase CPVL [Dermacentor silvarum]
MPVIMVGPVDRSDYSDSHSESPTDSDYPSPKARAPAQRPPPSYFIMLQKQIAVWAPGTPHGSVACSAVPTDFGAPSPVYMWTCQGPRPESLQEPAVQRNEAALVKSNWHKPGPEAGPVVEFVVFVVVVVVIVVVVVARDDQHHVADVSVDRLGGAPRTAATQRRRLDGAEAVHSPDDDRTHASNGAADTAGSSTSEAPAATAVATSSVVASNAGNTECEDTTCQRLQVLSDGPVTILLRLYSMRTTLSWIVLLLLEGITCESTEPTPAKDFQSLFLTPYIEACNYSAAKAASEVKLFQKLANVTAYSGFITVNETYNSNLFFLFVLAEGNKTDAPVLLWTQGGPGLSALFGEFLQNGPIAFDLRTNFSRRTNTLQRFMNIIYLDLPVGAGFSFTQNASGYSKSLDDITDDAMEFLRQFFLLFFEYKSRDFYVAGESYAARYSVSIADRLLKREDESPSLKGVIGGNGFLGPILDIADSSQFMYQLSMVDESGRDAFSARFMYMKAMAANQTLARAVPLLLSQTLFTNSPPTLFQNLTLYNDYLSPLYTERDIAMTVCLTLLNMSQVKHEFHVGDNIPFEYYNLPLLYSLAPDYLHNIDLLVTNVLNKTKVLLYTGQLDPLFPSVNQRAYLSKLQVDRI